MNIANIICNLYVSLMVFPNDPITWNDFIFYSHLTFAQGIHQYENAFLISLLKPLFIEFISQNPYDTELFWSLFNLGHAL
ncbi:hypothetical protein DP091_07385 [Paenibacillus sp. MDMC362]|nr:hypothetical protein DP091_07385 [Paenibacillus sp. MDMC362]